MEIERETPCQCIFPTLTSHQSMEKQTALVVLEQDEEEELHTFRSMASDDISELYRLFQVSWALVLAKYTGSHTVSFGVIPGASGDDQVIEQKEAVIDPRRPISEAVQLKSVRKWGITATALHELVNTCLVLKDAGGSPSCSWVDISPVRYTFVRIRESVGTFRETSLTTSMFLDQGHYNRNGQWPLQPSDLDAVLHLRSR